MPIKSEPYIRVREYPIFYIISLLYICAFQSKSMDKYSYISNADVGYLDQLYQNYKKDPTSVDPTWQKFFEGYEFSVNSYGENGHKVAC